MSLANEPDFKRTLRRAARLGLLTGKVSGEQWIEIQGILNNPVRKMKLVKMLICLQKWHKRAYPVCKNSS